MTDQPVGQTTEDPITHLVRERFRGGDLDALAAVYDAYAGAVGTVIRGVLGGGSQVDDAVQETFMRAWRGAGSFDPNRSLAPWLFTIARRTAIDVLRKEGRPTRSDHDELSDDIGVNHPGLEEAWERWQIRLALDRLPEDERVVMLLSHYNGFTHQQIAEHLELPPGTVKSRSYRAHQKLAGMLSHLASGRDEEHGS